MRTFGEDVLVEFLQLNGLEQMIRGHSVVEEDNIIICKL